MHSVIRLVINELINIKSSKERVKAVSLLMKVVFNSHFFNDDYYFSLKSNYRPKFLHVGLKFWESLVTRLITPKETKKTHEKQIQAIMSPEAIKVFVRGMSMQKGILFDVAS